MKVRVVKTPMMAYGGPWSNPVFSSADLFTGGMGAYQAGSGLLDTLRGFGAMSGLDTKLSKSHPKIFGKNFDFTKGDLGLDIHNRGKVRRTDRWNAWTDDVTDNVTATTYVTSVPNAPATEIDKGTRTTTGGGTPVENLFNTQVTGFAKGGMYTRPDGKIATNPILASAYDTIISLMNDGHDADIEDAFAREGGLTPQQARAIIQDIKAEIGMIKAQNGINLGQSQMQQPQEPVVINKPLMKDGGHTFLTSQPAYTKKSHTYFGTSNAPARDSYTDNNQVTTSVKAVPREDATIEAEKGEYILSGKGLYKIQGKKHYEGGTPLAAKGGEFIYSAHRDMSIDPKLQKEAGLKVSSSKALADHTPAKILERNIDTKQFNRLKTILDNPKSDETTKKTAAFMLEKMNTKLKVIGDLQEAKKKGPTQIKNQYLEQGQIQTDINEQKQYAHGGLTKYQVGTEGVETISEDQTYNPADDFNRVIEFVHPTGEVERLDLTSERDLNRYYSLYNRIASEGEDAGMQGNKPVTRIKLGNPRADLSEVTINAPDPAWTEWLIQNKGYLDELSPEEVQLMKQKVLANNAKGLGQDIAQHNIFKRDDNFVEDPRLQADMRRAITFGVTDDVTAGEWLDAVLNFSGKELNHLLTGNYETMGSTYRRDKLANAQKPSTGVETLLNITDPLFVKGLGKGVFRAGKTIVNAALKQPMVDREVGRALYYAKDALKEGTQTVEGVADDLIKKYPESKWLILAEIRKQTAEGLAAKAGRGIGYYGAMGVRTPGKFIKKVGQWGYNIATNPDVGYAVKPLIVPGARVANRIFSGQSNSDFLEGISPSVHTDSTYIAPAPNVIDTNATNMIDSTLNVDLNTVDENHVDNGAPEQQVQQAPPPVQQAAPVGTAPVRVQNALPNTGTHEEVIRRGNKHFRVRVDNATNRILDTIATYAVGGNVPMYQIGTPSAKPDFTKTYGNTYPTNVLDQLKGLQDQYELGLPSVLTTGTQNSIQMRQNPNATTGTYGTVDAGGMQEIKERAEKAGFNWFKEHPDWNAKDQGQNQQLMDAYNSWWKQTTNDPNAEYFKTGYKNPNETPGYFWRDEGKYGSYMNSMPFPYKKTEPVKETIPNKPEYKTNVEYKTTTTHNKGTTPMSSVMEYEFSGDYDINKHLRNKANLDAARYMAGIRQPRFPAPLQLDQARTIFTPLSEQPTLDEAAKQRSEDRRLALRTGNRAAYQAANYKNQENVNNALAKINQYNAQGFDTQYNSDALRNQGVTNTNRQLINQYIDKSNLTQDKTDEYNIYNMQDYLGNLANNEQAAFNAKAALLKSYNDSGMASTYEQTLPDGTKVQRIVYPTDLTGNPDPRWNGMNTRAGSRSTQGRITPEGFQKFQKDYPGATYKDYVNAMSGNYNDQ